MSTNYNGFYCANCKAVVWLDDDVRFYTAQEIIENKKELANIYKAIKANPFHNYPNKELGSLLLEVFIKLTDYYQSPNEKFYDFLVTHLDHEFLIMDEYGSLFNLDGSKRLDHD